MRKFAVRLPDKRRFLDALHHRESTEIPYYDMEFSPLIASTILGREIKERSLLMAIEDYIELLHCVGVDMGYLNVPWWLGREAYVDEKNVLRYKMGRMKTRSDLERMTAPEIDVARRRVEEFLMASRGTNLGLAMGLPTAASTVMSAMGFEAYYTDVYERPDFLEEFLDCIEEHIFPLTEVMLGYKPDVVCLGVFVCFKTGLSMSLEMTEKFIFSRIKRHMDLLKAKGVPCIVHSDGDNTPVMDRWISLGFSGFHPVEPSERHDIYEYKMRWGDRIALCGNIDCATVLSRGTPEEVARDTLEHLQRLSQGGGYICGSSHDVDDNVPLENLQAMIETVAGYRHEVGVSNVDTDS